MPVHKADSQKIARAYWTERSDRNECKRDLFGDYVGHRGGGIGRIRKIHQRHVHKAAYKTAITQLAAMLCAIILCLLTGADLFSAVGLTFSLPWAGSVLTGIFASRGSNYVSDIAGSLRKATKTE